MSKKGIWIAILGSVVGIGVASFITLTLLKQKAFEKLSQSEKLIEEGNFEQAVQTLEAISLFFLNSQDKEKTLSLIEKASLELEAKQLLLASQQQQDALFAQKGFKEIVEKYPATSVVSQATQGLGQTNITLLFSKIPTSYSQLHLVKPGESLASIAEKYNMTVELLMESNGLKTSNIRPGDRLKVSTIQFSILIDKSQNTLTLKANEELFKIYSVGTGKEGSTPIGEFKITTKIKEPTWFHPQGGVIPYGSKENLLGTRWLGIDSPGYGIHGTWEPDTIGKQASAGCVRLQNDQVEELYKIATVGTPVTIVE